MDTLSTCEEEVLMTIYQAQEAPTMMDVLSAVNTRFGHAWKPQTVSTFLARCVKKGYLQMHRAGRYAYYQPVMEFDGYRKHRLERMKELLFNGDTELMIRFLSE